MNIQKNPSPGESKVVINAVPLNEDQLREFKKVYGLFPKPGRYWYDKMSGLYGVENRPACGFMHAGHDYGVITREASGGKTGVVINGRELPQQEYLLLCQAVGSFVFPGSYWLDAKGNAGMEGNPTPMINLIIAAKQNGSHRGSGDNFWSSRYSAGNYSNDGRSGYVSVPGYGTVGYGD